MWLLPHLTRVSSAAISLYYRATRSGGRVPADGPVLLVANHPNSLLDPAFVSWAAERPVRFLAKAPLFRHPIVGWLVRGSGSLPVYRQQDDPSQMGRNAETFRAVFDALAQGSAVAIFPEGVSHSEPGLVPLKTGSARIALGAAARVGGAFPIVPVGLILRRKDRFRSDAHATIGSPVEWNDLAMRGAEDTEAVRELTRRIESAIRSVTLNLARWEDEPVIRTAEAIWAAARGADRSPGAHVARLAAATETLARLRASGDPRWNELATQIREHGEMLRALRLRPADVHLDTTFRTAARWAIGRLSSIGLAQLAIATLAVLLFWIPWRAVGWIAGVTATNRDTLATHRLFAGAMVFPLWIAGLCVLAVMVGGWLAAVIAAVTLPAIAIGGLYATERWGSTFRTVRRWMALRHDPRASALAERQAELARRLDDALTAAPSAR